MQIISFILQLILYSVLSHFITMSVVMVYSTCILFREVERQRVESGNQEQYQDICICGKKNISLSSNLDSSL